MEKGFLTSIRCNRSNRQLILLFLLFLFIGCSDTITEVINYTLQTEEESVSFNSAANSREIKLDTSIGPGQLSVSTASGGQSWCSSTIADSILTIRVTDNESGNERMTLVTVSGKNHKLDFLVTQRAMGFSDDISVPVARVTATSAIEGEHDPENMIDGNHATFFNSKVGAITDWPFYLDFYFENAAEIDYIIHTPRQDNGNYWGAIGSFELWAATADQPELTKIGEYDFGEVPLSQSTITFGTPILEPSHIQFRILSALQDRVSCAEMEFFARSEEQNYDYLQIFTDGSCSEIRPDVSLEDLNNIPDLFYKKLALAIYNGTYDPEYRVQEYRPYQDPDIQAGINKTSTYSLKDNATGIYLGSEGEELIVFVGDTKGQDVSINIRDFQTNNEETYSLTEGFNRIIPSISGLIYVYNFTYESIPLLLTTETDRELAAAKTVKIHFATGEVNGYFDIQKHSAEDWPRILANASYTEIDVLGRYSHMTWTTEDYRSYNTDIVLMTSYLDSLVSQQQAFMGLYFHDKLFRNRAYLHIDYSAAAAYSSSYHTAYNENYANVFCSESGFLSRMWVVGHEVGHTNQVRPGVKFAGTTEVTNNLYALYNQEQILGQAERLLSNSASDGYEFAFKEIIENEQPWVLPGNYNNHIPKVVPFWQLYLYFVHILKQEHFYHDLFEHYRTTEDIDATAAGDDYYGLLQLDFVRQVCNIGKMNMIDFFVAWGLLRPIDTTINDYGDKYIRITTDQIEALKAEIESKNFPKPDFPVQELTDENYKDYIGD